MPREGREEGEAFFSDPVLPVVIAGAALLVAAFCLRDAYEARGRERPLVVRLWGV